MRRLRIIGIGAGDPGFVTVEAVEALREVEAFFVLDKPGPASDLTRAREAIVDRFVPDDPGRLVYVPDPPRDRDPADAAAYEAAVVAWRDERVRRLRAAIEGELGPDGVGGFLVWGDPSLYDGTIRMVEDLLAGGLEADHDVVAGVSAVHALTARHRIPLNRVAGAVQITTGRRLAQAWPDGVDDVVVMLDSHLECRAYADDDVDVYWGAYLGTPDELLVSGRLGEVLPEIERVRAQARERHGWVMDTYLLRRAPLDV
ncbi:precorrin-6A synthase (deacetylating) [Agilicoccus flavus]|uniref:precorrin-6A synthase (deacetylating) n=1 Tax=Agilicoccus flavus TaxID=2775968 RepID=UPI001CF6E552|nr:precorrin-6A synthase (deacetylating) [Agilicoccus flavus]